MTHPSTLEPDLVRYLSNEHRHASISPETLEVMGKKAANAYLDEDIALNEAVAKLASAVPDMNAEQVKRVCEYANTNVYLALHDKNKTAGANSSYPQFELADPSRVIQDLSDGARPTVVTHTDVEYGRQPMKREKFSSARSDLLFSEAFGVDNSVDFSADTAVSEVMDAKHSLMDLKSHLERSGEELTNLQKQAESEYYEVSKRHLMDGGSLADLLVAARSVAGEEKIAGVMGPVVARLIKEKVASPAQLQDDVRGIQKVAHRIVNQEHPLVSYFGALLSFDEETSKIAMALHEIDEQLDHVNGFIRRNLMG